MTLARNVLILGGGIAGMSAAKALSESGFEVHLVERKESLGGNSQQWACMATDQCQNCGACLSADLVNETLRLSHTTLYTQTELSQIVRRQDGFRAQLNGKYNSEIQADAILLATGFTPFDPSGFQSLGHGRLDRVITTVELNQALRMDQLTQLLGERQTPAIAFIQCVGSRNREIGRDYCSQVCCKTALRQANKILHHYPGADLSVFHMDLQIIGKEFRSQYNQLANQIKLLQGVPAEVLTDYETDKLTVIREDDTTGARLAHHFDLIVLSVGMGPVKENTEIMQSMEVVTDEWGFPAHQEHASPHGIYRAGALNAPMEILTARAQGQMAAEQIICDLGTRPAKRRIAVLGRGNDSHQAAEALSDNGENVICIDKNLQAISGTGQDFRHRSLTGIQGVLGNFHLELKGPKDTQTITVDAIVVANGAEKCFPEDTIGMAATASVISLGDAKGRIEMEDASLPKRILFWLDHSGPEWKENCRQVLLLAGKLADQQKSITIVSDKILVDDLNGQRIYDQVRRKGVKFLRQTKDSHPDIQPSGQEIILTLKEATLPTVKLDVHCDHLVVTEKIVPASDNLEISRLLNIACDTEGFLQPANVRHRPVGSVRKGIFFVGSCHDEIDEQGLKQEMTMIAATLRQLDQGKQPEALWPQIRDGHCVKCLTCMRICPHRAIHLKAFRQPMIEPKACFNCRLCVANCPAAAIEPLNPPTPSMPDETIFPTVIFACQRSGALAAAEACQMGLCRKEEFQLISVDCACGLTVETLLTPLIQGSQQVMILACHAGNCRSDVGPENVAAKVTHIFSETHLPPAMLSYHSVAANEPAAFAALVNSDRSQGKGATS